MPKKDEKQISPLQSAIKEGDDFKKRVDEFITDCHEALKEQDAEKSTERDRSLYKRSTELLSELQHLTKQAEDLQKNNEPSKVMRFDSKKKDELKRLEKLKEKVTKLNKQLEPDDVEEDYFKQVQKEGMPLAESETEEEESEEEEDEEEEVEEEEEEEEEAELEEEEEETEDEESEEEESEEEESEEEDEEEDEEEQEGTMRQYEAIIDFKGQQPEDLSFSVGDILTIISAREDGWLEAENSEGQRGLVPITYLKVYNKYSGIQEGDDEDEEESPRKTPRSQRRHSEPDSGRLMWKNIKSAIKETSVTDVLHAMGAVPAGFRDSTLAKLRTQETYSMKNYLTPKLSPSCVSYRDLFFDPKTNKIRSRSARIQRVVALIACRQIPLPGTGIEITSRHVHLCLFDGKNVLSNIHTVRIQGMDKEQRTWNFNTKVVEGMKSLEFGELFVRSNSSEGNIGILFELCISYVRSSTNQEGEFSCGWVHMPLFDPTGAPAANKSYDLFVNGGTPYEKGVDVDPSVGRRGDKNASTNLFRSLMSGNRQPRLVVRLQAPTKEQKDLLDTLPDVLVSRTSYIQYHSFYRQILVDALLRDSEEPQSTELIHHPLLATFPAVADETDIMDVLRAGWAERLKSAKRSEKGDKKQGHRDLEAVKELYTRVFMDLVYPLCHSVTIPPPKFADPKIEQERVAEIQRLLKIGRDNKMAAALLLSPEAIHTPFDIGELSFNIIGPHCVHRQ